MMTKLKENIERVLLKEGSTIIDEIDALRPKRLEAMTEKAEREGLKVRIKEMQDFMESQTDRISEYDEQLVRKMIEKITIYDEKFVIEFKSGTTLDVRR